MWRGYCLHTNLYANMYVILMNMYGSESRRGWMINCSVSSSEGAGYRRAAAEAEAGHESGCCCCLAVTMVLCAAEEFVKLRGWVAVAAAKGNTYGPGSSID